MTPEQIKDLLIEWGIYDSHQQRVIELEYEEKFGSAKGEKHWLNFLKEKLEIEDYWKKSGLI
jgi:hypothetical protein